MGVDTAPIMSDREHSEVSRKILTYHAMAIGQLHKVLEPSTTPHSVPEGAKRM